MKKTTYILGLFSALWLFFLATGCSHQEQGIAEGKLITQSDCKQFTLETRPAFAPVNEQECIHFRYSENTLYLTHQNTAFNCCPGKIATTITVHDHDITIKEREQEAGCHCMCLYDLEMEISNLPRGIYRIIVDVPYLGGQPAVDFICNLQQDSAGNHCMDRNGYPWKAASIH